MLSKAKKALLICISALVMLTAFSFTRIPVQAAGGYYSGVLADLDDCLTDSEEAQLREILGRTANSVKCNVGIVITADLEGMSDERYADVFGYENFGQTSWVVLMLLNTHGNPAYTYYEDIFAKNDGGYDKFERHTKGIFNALYKGLEKSSGYDYYDGCASFCAALERYGGSGSGAVLAGIGDYLVSHGSMIFMATIFAFVITSIIVSATIRGYKKKSPVSASAYLDKNRTRITRQVDSFVREYTTSHTVSSSSHRGGGHGGGGHHHSSSHGHHR